MRVELLRKLPIVLLSLALAALPIARVYAATTQPYMKTFGGDVMTGGWFKSGNSCSTGGNYQDQYYPDGGLGKSGGILTYAKQSSGKSTGGSSSQYGVFSIGPVDNTSPSIDGFYSAGALTAPPAASGTVAANMLSFANGSTWGGFFEGSVPQSNCIPDYFAQKPYSAPPLSSQLSGTVSTGGTYGSLNFATCSSNVYCLTNSNVTVAAGTHLTIYVNNNVYIGNNIVYAAHGADSIPKFALVVSGSIYIAPGVTRLDGLYIAQPQPSDSNPVNNDDGIIWTCHPANTGTLDYFYPPQCTSPLVVNGSFIAKQVNFLRVGNNSDINTTASTSEDSLGSTITNCTTAPYSNCHISEIINYNPDVIMGGGFFKSGSSGGSTSGLPIDSIVSLPPSF